MLIAFNKPFGVLCQFTDRSTPARPTLAGFGLPAGVYPAGRLDFDSEGLLLLTDDGRLAHRLTDPRHKQPKTYWVQVEGDPGTAQLEALRTGVVLNDGPTLPARVRHIDAPPLWPTEFGWGSFEGLVTDTGEPASPPASKPGPRPAGGSSRWAGRSRPGLAANAGCRRHVIRRHWMPFPCAGVRTRPPCHTR